MNIPGPKDSITPTPVTHSRRRSAHEGGSAHPSFVDKIFATVRRLATPSEQRFVDGLSRDQFDAPSSSSRRRNII
jgi:hypothetical protein